MKNSTNKKVLKEFKRLKKENVFPDFPDDIILGFAERILDPPKTLGKFKFVKR